MRKRKAKDNYTPEIITFMDHSSSAGWVDHDDLDAKDIAIVKAVGWVIFEDKEQVVLGSFMDGKASHNRTRVMKGAIISRKRINTL